MLNLIVIVISSVIIIGIAIFYFKANPEQRLKMLPSAGLDKITPSEQQAIDRGELKVEPAKEDKVIVSILISVFLVCMGAQFYFNQKIANCELVLGIFSRFWLLLDFTLGLSIIFICAYVIAYKGYQKALITGYLSKKNRKSRKYRFLIPASQSEIKQEYLSRMLVSIFGLITFGWMTNNFINTSLKQAEMQNAPKFSLATYQNASQKLQQECLAKK